MKEPKKKVWYKHQHTYTSKINHTRERWGEHAVRHLLKFPFCQECGEKRLVVLELHHVHGRSQEVYRTLCGNCHMLHHSTLQRDVTIEDYWKYVINKKIERNLERDRHNKILQLIDQGMSRHEIAKVMGVTYATVNDHSSRRITDRKIKETNAAIRANPKDTSTSDLPLNELTEFIQTKCILHTGASEIFLDLYEAYMEWVVDANLTLRLNQKQFIELIKIYGVMNVKKRVGSVRIMHGVCLKVPLDMSGPVEEK